MADKIVRFDVCLIRNATQDSSAYQRRAESGHAERGSKCYWLSQRGSKCCWLSQRGSYWMKTQFSCPFQQ